MKNMKIGTRLFTGFFTLLLMMAVIAGISYVNVSKLGGEIDTLIKDKWVKSQMLNELNDKLDEVSLSVHKIALSTSAAVRKKEAERVAEISASIGQDIEKLEKIVLTDAGKKHLTTVRTSREIYRDELGKVLDFAGAGKQREAAALVLGSLAEKKKEYNKAVDDMNRYQDKEVERVGAECTRLVDRSNTLTVIAGFAALIMGFILSFYISKSITKPLNACVEAAEKIAVGNTDVTLNSTSDDETGALQQSMIRMTVAINLMSSDAKMLTEAAVAGRLSTRAEATKHQGDFRTIVQGVNDTLDAVIEPLNVSAEYIDRISKGDIPPKITDSYNGDFNEIKNNLNVCIDAIGVVVSDARDFARAAVAGTLSTRADVSKHQGEFRNIVQGFNEALDAVTTPINEVRSIMESMAGGNLNRRMTGEARGEFAILKDSLNNSMQILATAIGNVTQNARQVASASAQTSGAVGQISDGSQNQLHAIGQVATAVKQTAASIADVSRNTEEASLRAKDSVLIVSEGLIKMAQMVAVVNNIASNSEKINKITDVIEKIANKTNLLSLNAAIEAARAGEHGRGFAVVAEEVGKLAANAADSTQEIVELVNQAVKEANHAVSTVNEVSIGMQKISDGALQTESMLQRISAALEEQSAAVQEININITSLNKVAESNAAASEEITATVVELARLADNTRKEAEQFRV